LIGAIGFLIHFYLRDRKHRLTIKELGQMIEGLAQGQFSQKANPADSDEYTGVWQALGRASKKLSVLQTALDRTTQERERDKERQHQIQQNVEMQSQIQRSLGDIVSGLAHEINNPLTGIFGYIDLLLIRDNITANIKDKLIHIQQQAMRIKGIMEKLNQLDPDSTHTKYEIDLINLMDKMLKVMGSKHECRDITMEKKFQGSSLIIYGNHFSLWQAFDNIMENASDAIHENSVRDGRVVVDIRKSDDDQYAVIDIIDNGGGFKNLEKAFDPFFTTKTRSQKRGIGLTIVFNIIQEHMGSILVSNNEQNGATVSVFLPLMESYRKKQASLEGKSC